MIKSQSYNNLCKIDRDCSDLPKNHMHRNGAEIRIGDKEDKHQIKAKKIK